MASRPTPRARLVRTNSTVIAAIAVKRGDADAMLCGLDGRFNSRLAYIRDIIGLAPGVTDFAAMSLMITNQGRLLPHRHACQARSRRISRSRRRR